MDEYFYDAQTDRVYILDRDGLVGFRLFLILFLPFCVVAAWVLQYASFVEKYPALFAAGFLALSALVGFLVYHKCPARHPRVGMLGAGLAIVPIGIGQIFYAVPFVLHHKGIISAMFEWLVVTFFTVGLSFFVVQIGLQFKDGRKHLWLAVGYLLLALLVFAV